MTGKELGIYVHEKISSNYEDADPFYKIVSKDIVIGVIQFIGSLYNETIEENVTIQELLSIFSNINKKKYSFLELLLYIKENTEIEMSIINMLEEKTLNDIFSYINSAMMLGLMNGSFTRDSSFETKVAIVKRG